MHRNILSRLVLVNMNGPIVCQLCYAIRENKKDGNIDDPLKMKFKCFF